MKTAEEFLNEKMGDKSNWPEPYPTFRSELIDWIESYAKEHAKAGYKAGVLNAYTVLNINKSFEDWYTEYLK